MRRRLTFQNWIVDLGQDPDRPRATTELPTAEPVSERVREIEQVVGRAMATLTDWEAEFIRLFYFEGLSYRLISEQSGRAIHKLEGLHRRAVRKLKTRLQKFVAERYPVDIEPLPDCIVCQSDHIEAINRLILQRDRRDTWKPILKTLREEFGIMIRSPQALIGHEKYHCQPDLIDGEEIENIIESSTERECYEQPFD